MEVGESSVKICVRFGGCEGGNILRIKLYCVD